MHPTFTQPETGHTEDHDELPDFGRLRSRLAWVLAVLLLVLIAAFVPPLINVSQFQRRIASNLSNALGRSVHLDRVSLTLLPLPGFTLENFVVDEDPAFGYEPILRANEVRATVRLSSLWTHHVEFSRISLTEPTSLNLVRRADGRWNFEAVLLQASRIEAAPTGQTYSGPAPRFPYIEAAGARINLKLAEEKTPFALTDSEFAIWLPSPRQWNFRLEAHPARTDVAPSDAGVLRLEGTLGDSGTRAATLAEVPIDLRASWDPAPLAGVSRIAFGRDVGIRGELTLGLRAQGTVGSAKLAANLKLVRGRRADFVPGSLVSFDVACQATEAEQFHSFTAIQCRWPPANSSAPPVLIATGAVPSVRDPRSATMDLSTPALPAALLLEWLQAATPHAPTGLTGSGILAGDLTWQPPVRASGPADGGPSAAPTPQPGWSGTLELSGESLQLPLQGSSMPIPLGVVLLRSTTTLIGGKEEHSGAPRTATFELLPVTLALGGRQPLSIAGHFDGSGYVLELTGSALRSRLLSLGDSVPQFGEGLRALLAPDMEVGTAQRPKGTGDPEVPVHVDLTATRLWGGPQVWTDNTAAVKVSPSKHSRPAAAPSPAKP